MPVKLLIIEIFMHAALWMANARPVCSVQCSNKILYCCLGFFRVEKKERARLKTVKFHARTGMIESNRVSVFLPPVPLTTAPPPSV